MPTPRHNESGFTLVELLVAATLASIGFLGLAATHATALRATTVGRSSSVATLRAAEQIEILRRADYDAVTSSAATGTTENGVTYTRTVNVSASPAGDSKRVQVLVAWSDQFGPHQVELISVIAP